MILDQDSDNQPDNPELVKYMADNDFEVIIGNQEELNALSDFEDRYNRKTAHVSESLLKPDSYLIESLALVISGYISLLESKRESTESAAEALENLEKAIAQINEQDFSYIEIEEDTPDQPLEIEKEKHERRVDFIMSTSLVLSGQLKPLFDRKMDVFKQTVEKASVLSGKKYITDISNLLPPRYLKWTNTSQEDLYTKIPLIGEWVVKNKLTSPTVNLEQVLIQPYDIISDEDLSNLGILEIKEAEELHSES